MAPGVRLTAAITGVAPVRPRLVRQVAWTAAFAFLYNSGNNLYLGRPGTAVLCGVGAITAAICANRARHRRHARSAAHVLLAAAWTVVVLAALGGPGFYHGGLPYLLVLGAAASAMLGMRAGMAWSLVSGLGVLITSGFELYLPTDHARTGSAFLELDLVDYLLAGLLLMLFSNFFNRETAKVADALRQRNRQLARENRQRREAELEARTASSARTQFLASISHEIRTPMNSILGMAAEITAGPMEREQRERMELLERSAKSLLGLLTDLLDYSRLESGKVELEQRAFSLSGLAEEVVRLNRPLALDRVELHLEQSELSTKVVVGDELRTRQILQNLVSNALKFTREGKIEVHLRDVGPGMIAIAVEDTGPGLSAEQVARLGQPFEQADASVARRHGGTGLGLAIVKRLAAAMGGQLEIDSELGRGSTFRVRLALPPGVLPTRHTSEVKANALIGDLKVLVCEDNVVNQRVILEQLRRLSVTCEIVDNGRSAVERAHGDHFAALLLDYQLPDIDGPEVAKAIRVAEGPAGRHLPIIGLSANAMADDRQAALAAGMDDYLTKPVTIEALRQALARWAEPWGGAGKSM